MNNDPNKSPLKMGISMNRYYKYFRYQFPWRIIESVCLVVHTEQEYAKVSINIEKSITAIMVLDKLIREKLNFQIANH